MPRNKPHPWKLAILPLVLMSGCDNRDQRLVDVATRNAQQQALQNQAMSELNREVASGTRRLVEATAASTDKLLAMQDDLHRQHGLLESERRSIAKQRLAESLLAPIVSSIGAIFLCLLPLTICWRLLAQVRDEPVEAEVCGLLVDELLHPDQGHFLANSRPREAVSLIGPSPSEATSAPSAGD